MSENLYIGLSKKQVKALLKGKQVGKRPYQLFIINPDIRYKPIRIYVKMLSEEEKAKEPNAAFEWD